MKITSIESFVLAVPTPKPMALQYPRHKLVVAEISTDGGIGGLGYSLVFGGGGAEAVHAYLETRLAPVLVGEDPLFVERLWERMFRADMGIKKQGSRSRASRPTRSRRSTSAFGTSQAKRRGCRSTSSGAR